MIQYEIVIESNSELLVQCLEDKLKPATAESFNELLEIQNQIKNLTAEEKNQCRNKIKKELEDVEKKIKKAPRFSKEKSELQKTKENIQSVLYFLR